MVGLMILNLEKESLFVNKVRNGISCILKNVNLDSKLQGIGNELGLY